MENLSMAVVPESFLQSIQADITQLKELVKQKSTKEINSQWMESADARKMLGISQKTWQTYRDERVIPFAQIGRKIYVKRADIETYLNNHLIKKNQ